MLIPLQIGVYQGDPLSVVVFNTVINTLMDTLKIQPDSAYRLALTLSISCSMPMTPASSQTVLLLPSLS